MKIEIATIEDVPALLDLQRKAFGPLCEGFMEKAYLFTLRDKPGLKEEAAEWFWSVWTQGIHVKSQRIYDMTNTYKKKGISVMRFPGVLLRGI